ncbi:hypothetical protein ACEOWG_004523 [Bacillus cereus]
MTAIITVTFEEAVKAIESKLEEGKEYQYRDLSDILKDCFPKINSNQISGLVTKFSRGSTAIFETRKETGARQKYIFKSKTDKAFEEVNETKQFSVRQSLISNIQESISFIQNISFKDIQNNDDFKIIKDTEAELNAIIKKLQDQ